MLFFSGLKLNFKNWVEKHSGNKIKQAFPSSEYPLMVNNSQALDINEKKSIFFIVLVIILFGFWTLLFYYFGQYVGYVSAIDLTNERFINFLNKLDTDSSKFSRDLFLNCELRGNNHKIFREVNEKWLEFMKTWIDSKGELKVGKSLLEQLEEMNKKSTESLVEQREKLYKND